MEIAVTILGIGLLVFLGHMFTAFFGKTKIPDVLLLLLIGLCLGPLLGTISPDQLGVVGPIFATITLIVILFQGGIDLKLNVLRQALKCGSLLTVVNFVVTLIVTAVAIIWLTDITPGMALMLGAIVGGTSSAVVIPLVSRLKITDSSKIVLMLESALSDVLCIVVAITFLESQKLGEINYALIGGKILGSFLLAAILGAIGALGWSVFLNQIREIQNSMFTTPAFVFILYGIVEMLGYSGAIAALAFGITIGNIEYLRVPMLWRYMKIYPIALNQTEKSFFSELVFLLKTFFFIYIGISIQLTNPEWILIGLLLTVIIFVIRIPSVMLSVSKATPVQDAAMMAVMVPKGLAAAVLASMPLQLGLPGGDMVQGVTYSIIVFSIVLNSILIFLLERTPVSMVYNAMFFMFGRANNSAVPDSTDPVTPVKNV